MTNERARRCFAGAITAPAGLEAVAPEVFSAGAAAVPTGCAGSLPCWLAAGVAGGVWVEPLLCACGLGVVSAGVSWFGWAVEGAPDCACATGASNSAAKLSATAFFANQKPVFIASPASRDGMRA
jgi:hypothetical protein